MLAHLDAARLKNIDGTGSKRKIPKRFFGSGVEQADVSGFRSSRSADPLYTEMHPIAGIVQANDFIELEFGANAGEFSPGSADIDSDDLLGEDLTVDVGAENANWDFDFLAEMVAL